jgi:hypothetical protein
VNLARAGGVDVDVLDAGNPERFGLNLVITRIGLEREISVCLRLALEHLFVLRAGLLVCFCFLHACLLQALCDNHPGARDRAAANQCAFDHQLIDDLDDNRTALVARIAHLILLACWCMNLISIQ